MQTGVENLGSNGVSASADFLDPTALHRLSRGLPEHLLNLCHLYLLGLPLDLVNLYLLGLPLDLVVL